MSRGRSVSRAELMVLCPIFLHPFCLVSFYSPHHTLPTPSHLQTMHQVGLKHQAEQICHRQKPSHYAQHLSKSSHAVVKHVKQLQCCKFHFRRWKKKQHFHCGVGEIVVREVYFKQGQRSMTNTKKWTRVKYIYLSKRQLFAFCPPLFAPFQLFFCIMKLQEGIKPKHDQQPICNTWFSGAVPVFLLFFATDISTASVSFR